MPTTTNNGWTTPADTDLVKNGALAIRTLGDAIDTTLGVYAAPGAVKLNKSTFTTQSSVSVNNVFSATYSTYIISYNFTSSATTIWRLRLRAGGSDNTTSNYNYQLLSYNSTTLTGARSLGDNNFKQDNNNNNIHGGQIILINPYDTENTYGHARTTSGADATISDLRFAATTSFDGFSIYPDSGTLTGTFTVWGLRA
ncbi:MAG: hypothetical protein ACO25L_06245 [Candidatus Nanopelagicales bacterium]